MGTNGGVSPVPLAPDDLMSEPEEAYVAFRNPKIEEPQS